MDWIVHGVAKSQTRPSHFHLSSGNIPVGIIKWPMRTISQLRKERAGCRHLLRGQQKRGALPPAAFTIFPSQHKVSSSVGHTQGLGPCFSSQETHAEEK